MILISDPHGLPLRGLAPATAAETVTICPHDKPQPHARSVTFPDAWLPDFDPSMPYGRKCWWVCDRIFAAAVSQLSLDADFFWCVESDVAAKPLTWQRLIAAGTTRALDGIHVHLTQREADHFWFTHPTTPAWATHTCLGAVHRFSRRALQWIAAGAEANRNVFCEIHAPSTIHRNGGSTGDLHQLGRFYNNQCMQGSEPMLAINTSLLCHPLKNNSIEPSVGEVFSHR